MRCSETKAAAILQVDREGKVLGVVWNSQEDVLTYQVKLWSHYSQAPIRLLKRQILHNDNDHRSKFPNLSNSNCLNWKIYCDDNSSL